MKVLAVIPARYESQRFRGKVVADLCGKPLIQHVYEKAQKSSYIDTIVIATDDERVSKVAQGFKAQTIMTDKNLKSGTERIVEVVKRGVAADSDIIVNIQGDEPLVDIESVDKAVAALIKEQNAAVSTLYYPLERDEDIRNPNIVKVIKSNNDFAIYFSRFPIPYIREEEERGGIPFYKHIGVYCYKKMFLTEYAALKPSLLERAEKLEQLRILENGFTIKLVKASRDSIGVDTKEDLDKVKQQLKRKR